MSVAQPIDVRDMRIIHATFRAAYTQSAQLLRANPTPSPQRVAFLSDHVDFGLQMLHHHHESEDELLYPLLERRVPEQAERTEQIDHEHLQIATAIDAALGCSADWRAHATAANGEALASSLDQVGPVSRTVLDSALLHDVIGGYDPSDATSLEDAWPSFAAAAREGATGDVLKGLKVGIIRELPDSGFQAGVSASFRVRSSASANNALAWSWYQRSRSGAGISEGALRTRLAPNFV